MKKIIFCLLITTGLYAQTVYEVIPGTKSNEIALSIVNESKTTDIEKVTVALTNNPKGIELQWKEGKIEKLKKGEEKEILFTFDAKRIPNAKKDTLRFNITDKFGERWEKEIVIEYVLPKEFKLEQNYPNPFNPTTTITFSIPNYSRVVLKIFDILGREIKVLTDGYFDGGEYKVEFNANNLSSGVYFYQLITNNTRRTMKMILQE